MRRLAIGLTALAAVAVAVLVGLGLGLGVGPLAPGAPASWLYVAVVRNDEAEGAREIDVIDVETGERRHFALDAQANDIALSRDRRTLYVGSTTGRVLEVDAVRGTPLGQILVSVPGDVRRLLPLADGRRLAVVVGTAREAGISIVDLATGREGEKLSLGTVVPGRPILDRDGMLLPASGPGGDLMLRLNLDPLALRESVSVAPTLSITRSPPTAAWIGPNLVVASPFTAVVAVLAEGDVRRRRDLALAPVSPPRRAQDLQADVAVAADGSRAHLCLGTATSAARYVVSPEALQPERVGAECGRFAVGRDELYLGVRGTAELLVLDVSSGAVRRRLPLTGLAWRIAS
jgi:hypothetical protein